MSGRLRTMLGRTRETAGRLAPKGAPPPPKSSAAAAFRLGWKQISGPLFRKYIILFMVVVGVLLVSNEMVEILFFYSEYKVSRVSIQHEQAEAAAWKITQYIREIESQIGWTTQLPWSASTLDQRRFDGLRLLRQVQAITELSQLDSTGKEQLRVSRLTMDVTASEADLSKDDKFTETTTIKPYYGPVYFRRDSEPYMTLALAGTRRDAGVSVAEVNLKLIWDVVSQIKVGEHGQSYLIDATGRLIAHPDISLVLRNTDMTGLPQVAAARFGSDAAVDPVTEAVDIRGRRVLTAHAAVSPLGWIVFVELPVEEAYAALYESVRRSALLLLAGLCLASLAGLFLARNIVVPIQALRAGAARIGAGDLSQRISVKTGDELEALGDQFNDMAGRLQESYADLEHKVEDRTRELAQSVEELRALGEVSQAVNSTLDLNTVLSTIVTRAVQISGTDAGAIYVFEELTGEFRLAATFGMSQKMIEDVSKHRVNLRDNYIAPATQTRQPVHVADLRNDAPSPLNTILLDAGYRALVVVPLLRPDGIVGALVVRRRVSGAFPEPTVKLLETFASQSVLAIQNARLFHEIEEKGHQLEVASQHKSQFLANMSHELRTPLNAILGYTELILDSIYGEPPKKMQEVLSRVQNNGRHLLGLINDVLDLSKIEAGQLTLSLTDYSLADLVQGVYTAIEPLASAKKLGFDLEIAPNLPIGRGDERRLSQVLLNLVSNAIKFTDVGQVAVEASAKNGSFMLAVRDTGPGIAEGDQLKIFEEFQQADSSATKKKGGTGLGLAIARRIVTMHGGELSVQSKLGAGATFYVSLPVRVEQQVRQAT
jgi:signal transduction histidine kinase